MKTLNTHKEEIESRIKIWYYELPEDTNSYKNWTVTPNEVISLVEIELKQLYIKIAEGELERLESLKRKHYNEEQPFLKHRNDFNDAYNEIIQDQINYWTNILQELNK
jgi:hypothetical protein